MSFLVLDPAGLFIKAIWETEDQFQNRIERARERSERNAERREEARQKFLEAITGDEK